MHDAVVGITKRRYLRGGYGAGGLLKSTEKDSVLEILYLEHLDADTLD
jgi:hypothetical protein